MPARLLLLLLSLPAASAHEPEPLLPGADGIEQTYAVTRRREARARAPASVEVITRQDIENSGLRSIPEMLRFKAGLDVMEGRSADGNRAVVSVRGFPREFVNDLLVSVDGRTVYHPVLGGTLWDSLGVSLHDVERIEVVRGPAAVLYGSNAAMGAVIITTVRPEFNKSSVRLTGGSQDHQGGYGAVSWVRSGFGLGTSFGHERTAGFTPPRAGAGNDHFSASRGRIRTEAPLGPGRLEFLAGAAHSGLGMPGATNPSGSVETAYQLARWTASTPEGNELQVRLNRDLVLNSVSPLSVGGVDLRTEAYEGEVFMSRTVPWARSQVSAGTGFRSVTARSEALFSGRGTQVLEVRRGYLHARTRVASRLDLVAGLALEDSRLRNLGSAYNAALVGDLGSGHIVRLSHARAPTLPTIFQRGADMRYTATLRYLGDSDIGPQNMHAWEASWSFSGAGRTRLEATGFYLEIDERVEARTAAAVPVLTLVPANTGRAFSRGVELSARKTLLQGHSLWANWTLSRVTEGRRREEQDMGVPRHKANLGGSVLLGHGWSASGTLGLKGPYTSYSETRRSLERIPSRMRVDAVLSRISGDLEVYLAGQNLEGGGREYADGLFVPLRLTLGCVFRWWGF